MPTRELPGLLDSVLRDPNAVVMADSSRPETIEDLCARGYDIRGVRKYPGSLRDGIEELRGCDILVDPDCPEVFEELVNYAWQVDERSGQVLNKLNPKGADHYCDAIRYALSALEAGALLGGEPDPTGGVFYLDLFGTGRRERDNLPWHLRRGAWKEAEPRVSTEFSDDIRARRLSAINPSWK